MIDNSFDQAIAGYAKSINVILHADQSLKINDNGRGIPVDIHPKEGVPAVELILSDCTPAASFLIKLLILRRTTWGRYIGS